MGNTYTASLWLCLTSLLCNECDNLIGKQITCFSYGSGITSTMFGISIAGSVEFIVKTINLQNRLNNRVKCKSVYFNEVLDENEKYYLKSGYKLYNNLLSVQQDAYYLSEIDTNGKRYYLKNTRLTMGSKL